MTAWWQVQDKDPWSTPTRTPRLTRHITATEYEDSTVGYFSPHMLIITYMLSMVIKMGGSGSNGVINIHMLSTFSTESLYQAFKWSTACSSTWDGYWAHKAEYILYIPRKFWHSWLANTNTITWTVTTVLCKETKVTNTSLRLPSLEQWLFTKHRLPLWLQHTPHT